MPVYRYKAYSPDGRKMKGTITAESPEAVFGILKQKGLYPVWVGQEGRERSGLRLPGRERDRLSDFSTQLAVLITSGVPLREALRSLAEEFHGPWRATVSGLQEAVQEGASLSRAMSRYPEVFPEFYRAAVEASEASGTLPEALNSLAGFLEVQRRVNAKVTASMLYPAFMVVVAVFVLSFVFSFVIPKMTRIFEAAHRSLPVATRLLIGISRFMQNYWWLVFIALTGLVYGLYRFHRKNPALVHSLLLKAPLFRSLYYSRFTGTFGFLLKGGVPIVRALELAGKACGNAVLYQKLTEAARLVSEGGSVAGSLEGVSPVLRQLIHTGETSGTLAELMERASEAYREEFLRSVDRALALLEPAMVLAMGVVVGFIVFAVLLPIFQVNQLIR